MQAKRQADERLAVYGTLAPGRENHHILAPLNGHWSNGWTRGRLDPQGWGATHGFPAIVLDESADELPVHVFESADLPAHWSRLDQFEGREYLRVIAKVRTEQGDTVECCIYELNQAESAEGRL